MNSVQLPGTGRTTSQLAFGTSTLMGATSLRDSLALLEAAFDAGIRHFDTAPSYGMGQSESCLGHFLKRHENDVTVSTKYGIPPPKNQSLLGFARGVVKPILKLIPGIKQRLHRVAMAATRNNAGCSYTPAEAQATLDNSLRVLQVERIDIWLLHEAGAADLGDDALLRFIEDSLRAGKIGAFGVGSATAKIPALYRERRPYCGVLQYEWNPLEAEGLYPGSFLIHQRVLAGYLARIAERMTDTALCRQWSAETGADLAAPGVLAALLLKAALLDTAEGIVLVSSKKKKHIAANAQIAADPSLNESARRLLVILRREGLGISD